MEIMFKKKEKPIKEKKVRTMKVGTHKKSVIALWVVLIASVSFGVYKNFTAIDQHTTHEVETIQLRLNDTNGIENFVKNFCKSYYTWSNSKEAIEARTQAISAYLTQELQDLNVDTVRTDIPTSSTVTDVLIWDVEQSGENAFSVIYEIDQQIKEGDQIRNVSETYTVTVHVDADGLRPVQPAAKHPEIRGAAAGLFTQDMLAQLDAVFQKMAAPLVLKLYLDDTALSAELETYMTQLCDLTEKLTLEKDESMDREAADVQEAPCVRICREDGSWTGLAFHGVPGGHEFTSFVLGLYNAAGPGQALDEETLQRIRALPAAKLQILVSLSCTMCPELVTAAQRIAAENPLVTAEVYDLNHFPQLRERYHVMSVPCLAVNDGDKVDFGKKDIRQLAELLELQGK